MAGFFFVKWAVVSVLADTAVLSQFRLGNLSYNFHRPKGPSAPALRFGRMGTPRVAAQGRFSAQAFMGVGGLLALRRNYFVSTAI